MYWSFFQMSSKWNIKTPSFSFLLNQFYANVPLLYPLKTSKNLWFQGILKWNIDEKWVSSELTKHNIQQIDLMVLFLTVSMFCLLRFWLFNIFIRLFDEIINDTGIFTFIIRSAKDASNFEYNSLSLFTVV